MQNIPIDDIDGTPRSLIAIRTDYPDGTLLPWHSHRRAQLLYGATGVMHVATGAGDWVVPPQQAVWVPAGQPHQVRMLGVSTHSLYIEPEAVTTSGAACQVVRATPLLRALLAEAVSLPLLYGSDGRDAALVALLLHEVAALMPLPFHIPLPRDRRLLAACREFLAAPDIHMPAALWQRNLHMSERTFSRQFKVGTGLSFLRWKQQACVVLALGRLAEGESVTRIAIEFGYENPASFSAMFRRLLGAPPTDYVTDGRVLPKE